MNKPIKLPLENGGFSVLCGYLKEALQTAGQAGSAVVSLAESTATGFSEADEAINNKQDKDIHGAVDISSSGWNSDSTTEYPYYYDITVNQITVNDKADVTINTNSISTALSCGICPTSESLNGKIRIRAAKKPDKTIAVEYWVSSGKE